MLPRWLALLLLLFLALPAQADLLGVSIDGSFDDWSDGVLVATDPTGDGGGVVDLGRLWMANDQEHLYLRFETGGEVQPDEQQDLRLYLDTDMNASTGFSIGGIGADLVWNLGQRDGTFYTPGANNIDHPDIGLLIGPTVSSTEFEIGLRRDAVPAGGQPLFPGDSLRIIVRDADGGDLLPNSGSVGYSFAAGSEPIASLPLERLNAEHLRFAVYNIQNDGLFDGGSRDDALDRMFDAVDADIWVLCEVWNHDANDVLAKVEQYLPSGPGESWYAVKRDGGNVIVSRYPITQSWEINPGYRLTGALLDLRPDYDTDLLVLGNHWRCCTADADRQNEADSIIEFVRDAMNPGGVITLAENTPIIGGGDLNLVGLRQQLVTLLTGDIQDEGQFGPDNPPDWDGSEFDVPPSRQPDYRAAYTWRNDFSSYYPGVLDWIFYTGSQAALGNHYVLETRTMTAATLALYGLQQNDTFNASDHAPRVADFLPQIVTATPPAAKAMRARLLPNAPNPFNPSTELRFALDGPATVSFSVYDARGRHVRTLPPARFGAGTHGLPFDGRDESGHALASGVYRVRMSAEDEHGLSIQTRAITLVE